MIPKDCKRLAEVDFPIAEVSRYAAREKAIRHGHPSTLHLWWARRPLASSRAVLLALLWPDPCDPLCPPDFKTAARKFLPQVGGCNPGTSDADLREALMKFIGAFANWENASQRTYLEVSRALVKATHGTESPLVVDPFAGGGSIPLEAIRLGCEAFASDLNPVACLILKVMLEDIPRRGPGLAEEVQQIGGRIKLSAAREMADLYPKDPDGSTPIAYLWARTVQCESPQCGAELPLVRSFWICNKASRRRAFRPRVVRAAGAVPVVELDIFAPKSEKEVRGGTVARAKATCVACGAVLPAERVRAQLAAQNGGADVLFGPKSKRVGGARLLAVATLRPGEQGRHYRLPNQSDYEAVDKSQERLARILSEWASAGKLGLCPIPDEALPPVGTLGFRIQRYGMLHWGNLFTARQKVALHALSCQTAALKAKDTDASVLAIGKLLDLANSLCAWMPGQECPSAVFKLGRVKMSWDFVEGCPFGSSSGSFEKCTENLVAGILATQIPESQPGQAVQAMAQRSPMPDQSAAIWFTDPPYYDAIPYSDLSDFFLVWMKRVLPDHALLRDPFNPSNPLSPKDQEAVQDDARLVDGHPKDSAFFDAVMGEAFAEGARTLREDGIGAVVFAHKTTEGWEALLSGMIRGGWTITGSWPIATEMGHRLRARESAALATSVHLVCRPRPDRAAVGDWADVLRELPKRVRDWMERLQNEGVRGADLVFACIGPALEIFSRYTRVETAEGRDVALAEYLEKVWEIVGRSALDQVLGTGEAEARNGTMGAVEEDARLTALFLWTLQSTDSVALESASDESEEDNGVADEEEEESSSRGRDKGFSLVFDVVRRFAQPLGIDLPKWQGRVIEMKKGVVRLLPIGERAEQLFGADGAQAVAARLEQSSAASTNPLQGMLFPDMEVATRVRGRGRGHGSVGGIELAGDTLADAREATTLDRIHAAMLLQSGGRTNALRALLKAEQERGPEFLRLGNALSALYPIGSEEKRLVDAMLLAVPR